MRFLRGCRGVVLVLAIALMGCATASDTPFEVETAAGSAEETCFNLRDTRSYHALHDRYVYVRCVRKRQYLLTVDGGCRDLSHGFGIAISNEFNRVCSQSGAVITYRQFDQTHRCLILQVEAVDDMAAAEALVERRTTPAAVRPN